LPISGRTRHPPRANIRSGAAAGGGRALLARCRRLAVGSARVKQQDFEAQHTAQWQQIETWLDAGSAPADFPRHYRALCHHLAVAKSRRYGSQLVERLNALVLRGHTLLYGGDARHRAIWLRFFVADFPRVIYGHRRAIALSAALFLLTSVLTGLWCYHDE